MRLTIQNLTKSYGELLVLDRVTLTLEPGPAYCLMGPSGSGKTTLLKILLGLEQPDGGTVSGMEGRRAAAVFQENRLCDSFSPVENVMLAAKKGFSRREAEEELARLLPEESLLRPVSTLSGGMKRRTAICRALLAPSDAVFMDEPFTGLDEDTKCRVISYVKEKTAGKLLVISTHQEEEVRLFGGRLITLPAPGR